MWTRVSIYNNTDTQFVSGSDMDFGFTRATPGDQFASAWTINGFFFLRFFTNISTESSYGFALIKSPMALVYVTAAGEDLVIIHDEEKLDGDRTLRELQLATLKKSTPRA